MGKKKEEKKKEETKKKRRKKKKKRKEEKSYKEEEFVILEQISAVAIFPQTFFSEVACFRSCSFRTRPPEAEAS